MAHATCCIGVLGRSSSRGDADDSSKARALLLSVVFFVRCYYGVAAGLRHEHLRSVFADLAARPGCRLLVWDTRISPLAEMGGFFRGRDDLSESCVVLPVDEMGQDQFDGSFSLDMAICLEERGSPFGHKRRTFNTAGIDLTC